MKRLLILLLFVPTFIWGQTTPTERQVLSSGTAITRLPVASTPTVSSSDTIVVFKNGAWVKTSAGAISSTPTTPGSRTFYVDKNRTDTYTATGTISLPFKTIQAAVNQVATNNDGSAASPYQIDIVGAGTYVENVTLNDLGLKGISFVGHANVTINPASGDAINSTVNNSNLVYIEFTDMSFIRAVTMSPTGNATNFGSSGIFFRTCVLNSASTIKSIITLDMLDCKTSTLSIINTRTFIAVNTSFAGTMASIINSADFTPTGWVGTISNSVRSCYLGLGWNDTGTSNLVTTTFTNCGFGSTSPFALTGTATLNSSPVASSVSVASGAILNQNGSIIAGTITNSGTINNNNNIINADIKNSTIDLTAKVTNALPIANGGTNAITANAAFNNLAPSQTSNSGKFLTTDGTNTSWGTVSTGLMVGTTSITSGNVKNILFEGASNLLQEDNGQLTWDYTNNFLGIGTASPAASLDIKGLGATSATIDFAVNNSTGTSNSLIVRGDGHIGINAAPSTPRITVDATDNLIGLSISSSNNNGILISGTNQDAGMTINNCYYGINCNVGSSSGYGVKGAVAASGNGSGIYGTCVTTGYAILGSTKDGVALRVANDEGTQTANSTRNLAEIVHNNTLGGFTYTGDILHVEDASAATANLVRVKKQSSDFFIINSGGGISFLSDSSTTAGDAATINVPSGFFTKDATGSTFTLTNSLITNHSRILLMMEGGITITGNAVSPTTIATGSAVISFYTIGIGLGAPASNQRVAFLIIN